MASEATGAFLGLKKDLDRPLVQIPSATEVFHGLTAPEIKGWVESARLADLQRRQIGPFRRQADPSPDHERQITREEVSLLLNRVFGRFKTLLPLLMVDFTEETSEQKFKVTAAMTNYIEGDLEYLKRTLEVSARNQETLEGIRETAVYKYILKASARREQQRKDGVPEDQRLGYLLLPDVLVQDLLKSPDMETKIRNFLMLNYDPRTLLEYLKTTPALDAKGEPVLGQDEKPQFLFEFFLSEIVDVRMRDRLRANLELIAKNIPRFEFGGIDVMTLYRMILCAVIIHEVLHSLCENLTAQEEKEFGVIVNAMDLKTTARISPKNWIKGLKGIKRYRGKKHMETDEKTQAAAFQAFNTEMFCDLGSIYFTQQAGLKNALAEQFGVSIGNPKLQAFFKKFEEKIGALDAEGTIQVFTEKHLEESRYNKVRSFLAAATVTFKREPLAGDAVL